MKRSRQKNPSGRNFALENVVLELIILVLVLALVAYCVQFLHLPEPYAKVIQVILIVLLIIAIVQFALGKPLLVLR